MIPKAEGDSTPLGQRPLCVVRSALLIFRIGSTPGYRTQYSVLARECPQLMLGVPPPFRDILHFALGRLGFPAWFSFHREVRLRFKLATGLGVAWTWDGSISQGCFLSMVFIVALHAPWSRHLESLEVFSPQLYADNLKCNSFEVNTLLTAA